METICERAITLSDIQATVLVAFDEFVTEKGYSPTLEELATPLRVSKQRVYTVLVGLQLKGAIDRPGGPRSRKISAAGTNLLQTLGGRAMTLHPCSP